MIKLQTRNEMRLFGIRGLGKKSRYSEKPRLCVFWSLKHIYAQVIDDEQGCTLVSASTLTRNSSLFRRTQVPLRQLKQLDSLSQRERQSKALRSCLRSWWPYLSRQSQGACRCCSRCWIEAVKGESLRLG